MTTDTANQVANDAAGADVEEALAAGLLGVDASRRVGWAKAFEALRRVDALEDEVRALRDEQKALRRAYSRLLGFIVHVPVTKSEIFDQEIKAHCAAERTFRHQDAWDKGFQVAQEHQAIVQMWTDEDVAWRLHKRRANVELRQNLRHKAIDSGHLSQCEAITAETFITRCSCGESSGVVAERDALRWQANHDALVIFGVTYKEYKKMAKDGRVDGRTDD